MKHLVTITTLILILSCQIETFYPEADWTLMFYLGDDTYNPLSLTNDIRELTYNKTNTTNLRVIILYDGSYDGDSRLEIIDDPFNYNSRVIPISNTGIVQNSSGDIDMSNSDTLNEYIKYTQSKLPAKHYALYFGSHGSGFTDSTDSGLYVEHINNDLEFLTPREIQNAISDNQALNLVVFDACNMGNIENIYELKSVTDYVIASPENIPGPGNDYLGLLEAAITLTDPSPFELGKTTVNVYYNYYYENSGTQEGHENHSLNNLYDTDKISTIVESENFKDYLISVNPGGQVTSFNYGFYIDLFDIITDETIKESLNAAVTTADDGLYKWLSIYYPGEYYNSSYEETAFAQEVDGWVTKIAQ